MSNCSFNKPAAAVAPQSLTANRTGADVTLTSLSRRFQLVGSVGRRCRCETYPEVGVDDDDDEGGIRCKPLLRKSNFFQRLLSLNRMSHRGRHSARPLQTRLYFSFFLHIFLCKFTSYLKFSVSLFCRSGCRIKKKCDGRFK